MKRGVREGLFADVYEVTGRAMGIEHFATKTAADRFRSQGKFGLGISMLVEDLFNRLDGNWATFLPTARPSSKNFRWREPQLCYGTSNPSSEVTLERELIRVLEFSGNIEWSNQVPLISGIAGPQARRAVDLVRRQGVLCFEFVELKYESNNPISAAYEILVYGLLWLLSRRDRKCLGYVDKPILDAHELHLSVLAPRGFYSEYLNLIDPLTTSINEGLRILGQEHCVTMTFRFTAFPKSFSWCAYPANSPRPAGNELITYLVGREPI